MGDTFFKLATKVLASEEKYSLAGLSTLLFSGELKIRQILLLWDKDRLFTFSYIIYNIFLQKLGW